MTAPLAARRSLAFAIVLATTVTLLAPSRAPAAAGDCGQPVSNGATPNASDCLYILKAAVGTSTCGCVCDTDGSGSVVAADALRCLRVAVGQPLELACSCSGTTTTTTMTVTTVTTTSTTLPGVTGFRIATPDIEIQPGTEITYCYYFRTSNTEPIAITRWASQMLPATAQMIVFFTVDDQGAPVDRQPPGTLSTSGCGIGGSAQLPEWMYSARTASEELRFPSDDGAGRPIAAEIPPNSAGFVLIHNVNPTDAPLSGGVTVDADALAGGVAFTKSATFVTYNGNISIPPQSTNVTASNTCNVPTNAGFWWMSMHTHAHATHSAILHGVTTLFQSTDWAAPGAQVWSSAPFYTFDPDGLLTYECTYTNSSNAVVSSGDSYATDEQCMAITYFFPATKPLWCINDVGPF